MSTDRKQELIHLAIQMISERGYDSFSFADLARLSGITKASIHHHFATKTDLGMACLDYMQAVMREMLVILSKMSAKNAIVAILKEAQHFPWQGRICTLTSLHAEFNVLPEVLQQRLQAITVFEEQQITALLQRYVDERGQPLALSVATAARLLISSTKGAMLYGRTQKIDWTPEVVMGVFAVLGVDISNKESRL